ncbi:MAG TPA: M20/M25/M40 family metallo-hydrolase [Aggregatilineales bacterium]|nr:M20/M25/M40 family metallo-hydrolase [Anaerolineales bacterium]HRE48592.1 M20/M25/M40 family metallo-hydrolase [Aggregatilineales bacterium]
MYPKLVSSLCLLIVLTACGRSAEPPVTLAIRTPEPIPTTTLANPPTPTSAVSLSSARPLDPAILPILERVSAERLIATVTDLAGMGTRHVLSTRDDPLTGIGAARDYLLAQFTALQDANPSKQIAVWTQPFTYTWRVWTIQAENVVAIFPGSAPDAGVYIVGAHYDSVSNDPFNGNMPAPGANDNASGVAAVLEIARILAPRSHRATVIFVAFSGEETGRQGSLAFVNEYLRAQNPAIPVAGMVNLDIVGSPEGARGVRDPRTMRLFSASPNDSVGRAFARQMMWVANTYITDMNVVLQTTEDRDGRWGDQMSFTAVGYPSARLMQGVENTARQHSPYDTVEGVDAAYLRRATRVALAAILTLAEGLPPPLFQGLRREGDTISASWTPVSGAGGYLILLRGRDSLFYDTVLTVNGGDLGRITWEHFGAFETIAMMSVAPSGWAGAASAEVAIGRWLGQ